MVDFFHLPIPLAGHFVETMTKELNILNNTYITPQKSQIFLNLPIADIVQSL